MIVSLLFGGTAQRGAGYHTYLIALYQRMGTARQLVLATGLGGRTTARMMSCFILDWYFYFQTDLTFLKYEQMKANPCVALCTENIQIEGRPTDYAIPWIRRTPSL